jgi:exopolysaccharide production protein ExoZ
MTAIDAGWTSAPRQRIAAASTNVFSIQALRAVAALAVVMFHIQIELPKIYGPDQSSTFFTVGAAGVDLFFVISGFVMVYASESLFGCAGAARVFLLKRLCRIAPLYWLASGIILAQVLYLVWRTADHTFLDLSVADVIASFAFFPLARPSGTMEPLYVVGWTLNYEMFFYVVFSAALFLGRCRAVLAVTAALATLVAADKLFGPFGGALSYWADPIVLEFVFGMWIAIAMRDGLRIPPAVACLMLVGASLAILSVALHGRGSLPRVVEFGIPIAVVVAALTLADWRSGLPRPLTLGLAAMGDASYALYLMHLHAFFLVRLALAHHGPIVGPWVYAACLLTLSVALAVATHHAFEKPSARVMRIRGRAQ